MQDFKSTSAPPAFDVQVSVQNLSSKLCLEGLEPRSNLPLKRNNPAAISWRLQDPVPPQLAS